MPLHLPGPLGPPLVGYQMLGRGEVDSLGWRPFVRFWRWHYPCAFCGAVVAELYYDDPMGPCHGPGYHGAEPERRLRFCDADCQEGHEVRAAIQEQEEIDF